jgi:hypothetical protein
MEESMERKSGAVLLGLLIMAATSTAAWAQATAEIAGTVRDQSGAVLPGVTVTATQTATGLARSSVTNETGSYVLPDLPIGPYRLEAALPGFRTFAQTGIILQVGSNPVINVSLAVGQVAETIEVQADAALVETRTTGVGQVIDNVRVTELPLAARNVQQLIILSGNAVGGGAQNSPRNYPTDVISVGGGLPNGLTYLLDGGTHNDPYGNLNLPLPFPDAMQEFKVETSSVPAQYGQHSAGAVNVVTKSGTNDFHGNLFEFVRNKLFNARNAFALERDGLKRNQFGGVVGGPIVKNKLFFFGGDQVTRQRSAPVNTFAFVPTPQMLSGDWTAITSPACNQGRQITLKAPFVNNTINPALFSTPALNLMKMLPTPTDPCGQVVFGRRANANEQIIVSKVDYQQSAKNSIFGRYELARLDTPSDYDGHDVLSVSIPDYTRRAHSFVLGDTYLINAGMVSSFHFTALRTLNDKHFSTDFFNYSDLGVKNLFYPANYTKIALATVSGAFTLVGGPATPGHANSTAGQLSEDISWARGTHQIGFGVNYIHSMTNWLAGNAAPGSFTFGATNTGLSMGDLMLGKPTRYSQNQLIGYYLRRNYSGAYLQDTWKATPRLTVNSGLRWEPYVPPYDEYGQSGFFNRTAFDQGIRSTVFKNAPAGLLFAGDPGVADNKSIGNKSWFRFAPRIGLAWDPRADGLTVVRASYGLFYDYPHFDWYGDLMNTAPLGSSVALTNMPGGFADPWQGNGGNPFPVVRTPNMTFPAAASYSLFPQDFRKAYIHQWNLAIQKQVGMDWLVAANYLGNSGIHLQNGYEADPAVYIPGVGDANGNCTFNGQKAPFTVSPGAACSTTSNTNQRRTLYLANPAQGQYYGTMLQSDDGATRNYHAMALTLQKRRTKGVTVLANYTLSHCIDDGLQQQILGTHIAERRRVNRGNCELDRRHNFNLSTVYETPQFSNRTVHALVTGWQLSGIVRLLSGPYLSLLSGLDNAFSGTGDERPNQILASPYALNKTHNVWLNPAAFSQVVAPGTYGNMGARNILGPGSIQIDTSFTRTFRVREKQSVMFRAEMINMPNHVNPCPPTGTNTVCPDVTLTDSTFGRILSVGDPRIMQMALKYVF